MTDMMDRTDGMDVAGGRLPVAGGEPGDTDGARTGTERTERPAMVRQCSYCRRGIGQDNRPVEVTHGVCTECVPTAMEWRRTVRMEMELGEARLVRRLLAAVRAGACVEKSGRGMRCRVGRGVEDLTVGEAQMLNLFLEGLDVAMEVGR